MNRRVSTACVAVLAISSVAMSACSSSSKVSNPTSTATGAGTSGASIRLMVDTGITPSAAAGGQAFPGGAYGAQAAAKALNAAGGINGHKVVIDVCDNKSDPNVSAQCARHAKSNGDIAVVGSFDSFGAASLLPVLETEKIPYIGALPSSAVELSSPMSFQFDPGSNLASFATAQLWIDSKCTKVVEINAPVPGVPQVIAGQTKTLAGTGIRFNTESIAINGSNMTPVITSALAHKPDCLTAEGPGPAILQIFTGARKLGYSGKLITSVGSLPSTFLAPLGKAGEGLIALNSSLSPQSSDPMVKQYYAELMSYFRGDADKTAQNANQFSQEGWSAVQLVKQALEKAGAGSKPSSASLLSTIPTMCDVNVGNFYPHVNFCKPVARSSIFPRVFSDYFRYFTVKAGMYVPIDDTWHNLANTLPA